MNFERILYANQKDCPSAIKNHTLQKQKTLNKPTFRKNLFNENSLLYLNNYPLSFCGMKKSQFSGIELIMVNYLTKNRGFNVQSKGINSNDDFQTYCKNILDKEYYGEDNIKELSKSIDPQTQLQKEAILKEWINYISKENDAYNPAIQLLIISN